MNDAKTRREFFHGAARAGMSAAGLALLGGCAVGQGQGPSGPPAARVATVGVLTSFTDEAAADEAALLNELRQGMGDLGWVEGENVRFERRSAEGDSAALADLAAELVRLPVDVMVVLASPAIPRAAAATGTLPIVMVQGPSDAVERGLAASIQRPGGNVTGLLQPPREIFGKSLELLVEAVPHVSRVACIVQRLPAIAAALRETALTLGVQVEILTPQSERELELAFTVIEREGVDGAMLVGASPVTNSHRAQIVDFANQRQLAAAYPTRVWAVVGGLMSYGNSSEHWRRAAFYVDRILRGVKPGDLPIESPTRHDLVINLKTADVLGLTIPDSLLAQATEVIR